MIIAIAAHTRDRGIGFEGGLPWPKISDDFKYFKKITDGHTVVMGRKTYESIGKPLTNRRNIVLTSSDIDDVEVAKTKDEVLELVRGEDKVFIIGGAKIYELFLEDTDELDLLIIYKDYKNDTKFPEYENMFRSIISEEKVKYQNEGGEYLDCVRKRLSK